MSAERRKSYQRNKFICEGCAAHGHGRPLPDDWKGFGTSAAAGTAYWCPRCQLNRTMANESRPTQAMAIDVARRRGLLIRIVKE
jgi:hypothetical protein